MSGRKAARQPLASRDPYAGLEVGQTVLLSSPLVDPVHWFSGEVLWRGGSEILVQQYGIAGLNPHKQLHDVSYVRFFGTSEECSHQKMAMERVVRDAASLARDVQEQAQELQCRLVDLFEKVAAQALEAARRAAP